MKSALFLPVAALAVLTGCAGIGDASGARPSGTTTQQIRAWEADGGMVYVQDISADLSRVQAAAAAASYLSMEEACNALGSDTAKAAAYRPIPDAGLQSHWNAMLLDLNRAASDCTAGTAASNSALIDLADLEIRSATRDAEALAVRMDAVNAT